jgi:hypothetical protein
MMKFLSRNKRMIIDMYTGTTAYEEELKQEAIEMGKSKARIKVAKILVTKENWPLSKAANFFGLSEIEKLKVADELGDMNYKP